MIQRDTPFYRQAAETAKSGNFDIHKDARYIGRMDWSDPQGPVLSWAGSSITVRFTGTAITLRMSVKEREESWLDLTLDGQLLQKVHIKPGLDVYEVAALIEDGVHTVEVFKRVEAMFGTVQFLGFELPQGGAFLTPPPHLNRRMEIIGDSISCGSGNEGKNGDPNVAENENCSLAYGILTARALDAEPHVIGVSGIGLVVNYGDERENTMPDQYGRFDPLRADSVWDFTSWIPDVVVINLGTNDNHYAVEQEEFVDTYKNFIARIQGYYPQAHIYMTLGPFQNEPVKDYIYDAYMQICATGNEKVHYLLFDKANVERDGLGETGHPNTITHAHMAEQLTREMKARLSW